MEHDFTEEDLRRSETTVGELVDDEATDPVQLEPLNGDS